MTVNDNGSIQWTFTDKYHQYPIEITSYPCCPKGSDGDPNCHNIYVDVKIPNLDFVDFYISDKENIVEDKDWQDSLNEDITDKIKELGI